jgi:hypothetical protein
MARCCPRGWPFQEPGVDHRSVLLETPGGYQRTSNNQNLSGRSAAAFPSCSRLRRPSAETTDRVLASSVPQAADKGYHMYKNHAFRGIDAAPPAPLRSAAAVLAGSAATSSRTSSAATLAVWSFGGLPAMLAFDGSLHFHVPARFHVDAVGGNVRPPEGEVEPGGVPRADHRHRSADPNGRATTGTIAHPT